jgi:predicted protein tyrosine phosphatase
MKFKDFEIEIRNITGAVEAVLKDKNKWSVVSIRDSVSKKAPVDSFKDLCQGMLPLIFDDVYHPEFHKGSHFPTMEDVKQALDWAKDKTSILVHCHAGISRSSAIAYLIACQRVGPKEAIKLLNIHNHWPNILIVKFGAILLGDPEIDSVMATWQHDSLPLGI